MASYPKDFCENYLGSVQNSKPYSEPWTFWPSVNLCWTRQAYFRENSTDWRVGTDFFAKSAGLIPVLLGDSTFGADLFCQPGQEMSKLFSKMGGQRSNWFCIDNLNQKPEKYFKERSYHPVSGPDHLGQKRRKFRRPRSSLHTFRFETFRFEGTHPFFVKSSKGSLSVGGRNNNSW